MTGPSAQRFLSTLALLLLPACAAQHRMLPICVQDARSRAATPAVVDLYAVSGDMELRRQTITPVDEYFATLGRPSRPENIRRVILDPRVPSVTLDPASDSICRQWQEGSADTLIAVTPKPERRSTSAADPRRITFPLDRSGYPAGTRSLQLTLTDGGLFLQPSQNPLPSPKN